MNEYTLEYFIPLISRIYFWVFIITFIVEFLYMLGDEYDEIRRKKIEKGTMPLGISATTVFLWVLFFLSCYYAF